jgi:hypothetical protein
MKNVSAERVAKFFTKMADRYRVNKAVTIYVSLRARMSPEIPLFKPGSELQEKIISTLHYALNPSGFLLLGSAESAASYPQVFTPLNKKNKIYSKKLGNSASSVRSRRVGSRYRRVYRHRQRRSPSAVRARMMRSYSKSQICSQIIIVGHCERGSMPHCPRYLSNKTKFRG